jgi:sulfonate transport system substrate-binding protein
MTPDSSEPAHIKGTLLRYTMVLLVVAMGTGLFACDKTDRGPAGRLDKITIAYSTTADAILAEVAQVKGFYKEEGLEVIPRRHAFGKAALDDMLTGKADFATVAEVPAMFAIMNGQRIAIVATIQSSNTANAVVARKDRRILSVSDLKGKKIAITEGTTSDFFLDTLLAVNGIGRREVTVVNVRADEAPKMLAHGDVDAVSAFAPYTLFAIKELAEQGIAFYDPDAYTFTFNMVATREFVSRNPEGVKKILRALLKAEEFARNSPITAQKIVADFTGIDATLVRKVWDGSRIEVCLDQSLLLALEDESRWAIRNRLTKAEKVPNYLDFIYLDGLKATKPQGVRILR